MSHVHSAHCRCPKVPPFLRDTPDQLAAAYRLVLKLTQTLEDPGAPESVKREASARRLVTARRHGISIIRFPPRRRRHPEQLLANDPGRLLIPHCARARTADTAPPDRAEIEALFRYVEPVTDVAPVEVVYVHCGLPTCTACALAEA